MENIILFRFHKDFDSCVHRVETLKYFNPDIPIYGLYGGPQENYNEALSILGSLLLDIRISSSTDPAYKWLHADQTLKEWHKEFGQTLDFKYLYDYEYDILTLDALSNLYPRLGLKEIVLSGVEELKDVENIWEWTSKLEHKHNFEKLSAFMDKSYGLKKPQYASLGPGPYLSKDFLNDFLNSKQSPELIDPVVSEIIYPFYAEALGYKIINSRLHPSWFDKDACTKYFNCEDISIEKGVIIEEAKKSNGRRSFHPVKYTVTLDEIKSWLKL